MNGWILAIALLTLAAAAGVPLYLYLRLRDHRRAETARWISYLDRNLGAAVKLLEVRDYYEETAATYKRMLDEAYKEGNRFRQDQFRKLIERLETLKARTIDKQVRILEQPDGPMPSKKHRRRRANVRPNDGRPPETREGGADAPPPADRSKPAGDRS